MRGGEKTVTIRGEADIPFPIKRIFYIYGAQGGEHVRGKHANRKSEFLLFCVSGKCRVRVLGEHGCAADYALDAPGKGLYLPRMVWKEMYDFSDDCVLMVLSNEYYDAAEYIRDFDEYLREMNASSN